MNDVINRVKTAWIRQLKEDWKVANYHYFKDSMRPPNLELSSAKGSLGRWKGGHYRCLSVSILLIRTYAWEYVQEVLYHEMAHQYVEETLGIKDDMPHGEAFRRVCLEHCIDPTATGDITTWVEKRKKRFSVRSENNTILDKVHKLLALAQSANEYEAQTAMAKAHELLLKHNLSLLDAQTKRNYIHRQIGEVGRRNPVKSILSSIISKFFFVETIWTFGYDQQKDQRGRILEIYGTPENVEMAKYVYDYLQNISEFLWREYKGQKNIRGNIHRRSFIYGLLEGFYHKLDYRVAENRSKKLIWKGDPRLKEFYRQRNPRLTRSSSRYSRSCQDAYNSGMSRGKNLVIRKGIHDKDNAEIRCLQ